MNAGRIEDQLAPHRDGKLCTGTEYGRAVRARLAAALLFGLALAVLSYAVQFVPAVAQADLACITWVSAHREVGLTTLMVVASALSGPAMTGIYGAFLVLAYLLPRQRARRYRQALAVAFVVYGGIALNVVVKHLVHRPRPNAADALERLDTYSFPSGHAAAVTVFGAVLSTLLVRSQARSSGLAIAAVVTWVVVVVVSRVYLGTHFPTDVLAGVLEGLAWVLMATAALDRWHFPLGWPTDASDRRRAPQ